MSTLYFSVVIENKKEEKKLNDYEEAKFFIQKNKEKVNLIIKIVL
jgi:hypothetical protein